MDQYHALLGAFLSSHARMRSSIGKFDAILADASAGRPDGDTSMLISGAARNYEVALREFTKAAADLNEFLATPSTPDTARAFGRAKEA